MPLSLYSELQLHQWSNEEETEEQYNFALKYSLIEFKSEGCSPISNINSFASVSNGSDNETVNGTL